MPTPWVVCTSPPQLSKVNTYFSMGMVGVGGQRNYILSAHHGEVLRAFPSGSGLGAPTPLRGAVGHPQACRIRESTLVRLVFLFRCSAFIVLILCFLSFSVKSFAWTPRILGCGAPSLFLSKRREVFHPFFLPSALTNRFNMLSLYLLLEAIEFNLRPLRISPLVRHVADWTLPHSIHTSNWRRRGGRVCGGRRGWRRAGWEDGLHFIQRWRGEDGLRCFGDGERDDGAGTFL